MKNTFKLFVTLFLLAFALQTVEAGNPPTFNMTVKNITTLNPASTTRDSLCEFDVYCQQTNFGGVGVDPFEYCCGQFTWYFNKAARGNGNLFFTFRTSQLPAGEFPPSFQVDTANGYLQASGNLPNSSLNYFLSSVFPGTLMGKYRLRTSLNHFPLVPINLRFKLGPAPNTFIAYFLPYPDSVDTDVIPPPPQSAVALMDTVTNIYSVENSGYVLPVELSSFVSSVNRNIVTLNWTTATETNNQGFDIERSITGSEEWSRAGNVAGNGTTTGPKDYTFTERANSGHYSYRLKQIDFNGEFNYHALSAEVIVGIPTVYAISQNYPNPFNPSTKIDFELPYDGKVSILLYDISGREVGKLVNEVLTAGYHNVSFNGSNLASGMYFYRINATGGNQNFVATKKMVLIK